MSADLGFGSREAPNTESPVHGARARSRVQRPTIFEATPRRASAEASRPPRPRRSPRGEGLPPQGLHRQKAELERAYARGLAVGLSPAWAASRVAHLVRCSQLPTLADTIRKIGKADTARATAQRWCRQLAQATEVGAPRREIGEASGLLDTVFEHLIAELRLGLPPPQVRARAVAAAAVVAQLESSHLSSALSDVLIAVSRNALRGHELDFVVEAVAEASGRIRYDPAAPFVFVRLLQSAGADDAQRSFQSSRAEMDASETKIAEELWGRAQIRRAVTESAEAGDRASAQVLLEEPDRYSVSAALEIESAPSLAPRGVRKLLLLSRRRKQVDHEAAGLAVLHEILARDADAPLPDLEGIQNELVRLKEATKGLPSVDERLRGLAQWVVPTLVWPVLAALRRVVTEASPRVRASIFHQAGGFSAVVSALASRGRLRLGDLGELHHLRDALEVVSLDELGQARSALKAALERSQPGPRALTYGRRLVVHDGQAGLPPRLARASQLASEVSKHFEKRWGSRGALESSTLDHVERLRTVFKTDRPVRLWGRREAARILPRLAAMRWLAAVAALPDRADPLESFLLLGEELDGVSQAVGPTCSEAFHPLRWALCLGDLTYTRVGPPGPIS